MPTEPSLSVALVYDDSLDRPGGVAQHVEMLRRGLVARGHEVHVLAGHCQPGAEYCRSLSRNVTVRFNGNRLTIPLIAHAYDLERVLAELSPDVLHVQLPYSPVLAGRIVTRAGPRTAVIGTSHVFSEHRHVRLGARVLAAANARSSRRFDRVLAVSQVARSFAEQCSQMRVDAIVPNMVDVQAIRAATRDVRGRREPTVAFIGSLVRRKGVDRLLAAWPAVLDEHPEARLVIAGDGPLRRALERQRRRLRGGKQIELRGAVSEAEKTQLLAAADVACFPSLFGESFGIVLLEAMAAGTPVVLGGDNAGYRDVLQGRADSLVDPLAPDNLARALSEGLCEARGAQLRKRWQDRLAARHDLVGVVEEIVGHYHQALAMRRGTDGTAGVGAMAA